jgi:hypothetical protein
MLYEIIYPKRFFGVINKRWESVVFKRTTCVLIGLSILLIRDKNASTIMSRTI